MKPIKLLLLVFFSACVASAAVSERVRLLVGTWFREYPEADLRITGEKTFRADGTAVNWIRVWRRANDGPEVLVSDVTIESRWRIEGDRLITYQVRTKPEGLLDTNKEIQDEILAIDRDTFQFKTDEGKVGIYKRKPNQSL